MEGVKIQSSPRPTRRIVAGKRQRPDDSKNCVKKLLRREISRAGNWAFNRSNSQEKFRNFHLQVSVCLCSMMALAPPNSAVGFDGELGHCVVGGLQLKGTR